MQCQAPSVSDLLQVAATKPPARSQTATPARKAEEEEGNEAAAATPAHKAEDGPQAAKRQKISVPDSEDIQHVEQSVEEARKVAAATKDALGLKGNRFSPLQVKHMT